jgi:hypothetical protein
MIFAEAVNKFHSDIPLTVAKENDQTHVKQFLGTAKTFSRVSWDRKLRNSVSL